MIELVSLILVPWLMIVAATSDLFTMTIPNRICLALFILFFIIFPFTELSLYDLGLHCTAFLSVLIVTFILFAFGVMGGGDAKFASVIALWLGLELTLDFALWTAILGGLLTFLLISMRIRSIPFFKHPIAFLSRLLNPDKGIPYGIALSAAGLIVFMQSVWMQKTLMLLT